MFVYTVTAKQYGRKEVYKCGNLNECCALFLNWEQSHKLSDTFQCVSPLGIVVSHLVLSQYHSL